MSSAALHPLFETPLPRGWQLTNVDAIKSPEKSACVAGPFGSNISSKFFVESGVPIIRGGNLRDDLTRFVPSGFAFVSEEQALKYKAQHVRAGDLVFTCWGTIGQVGLIPADGPFREYIISNKQLKLRADTTVADPLYLFYYFASPEMVGHVRGKGIGAAVPGINLGILKELPVVLPSMRDQRRIVRILSAYDDLIENCERRIRVLDEMARALYREWFVLFRYPGHEKTPLVDSALGRIPKGWTYGPIREVYSGLFDGPHATPAPATEGPIFLGIGNMTESGRLDLSSVRHIAEADFDRWTKRVTPQAGDIVFTYEATLHRYALIPDDFRGCLGRRLALIRVDPAKKCGRFLFLTLLSEAWHEVVSRNTLSGATVDRVPLSKLPEFPIIRPPMPLVAQFDDTVQPIIDDQTRLSKLIVNLRRTRDLLLPRLLSGQLAVEDAA